MKKTIFKISVLTALAAGTILTGCQSPQEKEQDAREDVQEAKQDLNEAKQDANAEAQKAASEAEWKAFRAEAELKIRDNEIRIAELRAKMKESGKVMDKLYEKKIERLEEKNREMRAKMVAYENNQSDWETFKREFNHDMDEIGQAFKDLTVDNEK